MNELNPEIEVYDNVIIGAGAGGLAAAKLVALSQIHEKNALFEQHDSPGGCAGYFARGHPKSLYDVGATQLVALHEGELQSKLFSIGFENATSEWHFDKIENIHFHFPNDKTVVSIDSESNVIVKSGELNYDEQHVLQKIFLFSNNVTRPLWESLGKIPKIPMYSFLELFSNIKIFVKIKNKLTILFLTFLNFNMLTKLMGLKNHHFKSKNVINSLLLDTVQNEMKKVPSLFGIMGLSILGYGIYRLQGGMRTYFYKLSLQIQKKGLKISYGHELKSIQIIDAGFLLDVYDKRHHINKKILVKKNLFLNLTLWNILKIFNEKNSFTKKLQNKLLKQESWGACALYGYFENKESFPQLPWYHQIFSSHNEIIELNSSLYLSVYQAEENNHLRHFTATIHMDIKLYNEVLKTTYHEKLRERLENALQIKVIESEFATPKTYEKYTLRSDGKVGGFITNSYNMIFPATPSEFKHPNKISKLYIVGDSVFPGQGVVSSSLSGIIAWERAFNQRFSNLK
ncbi:NAD(P)-binding protein [Silvanigrella aquatica]|uniref:Amine oxidase domain-containing protein n=1 Tax=Silvanigrella aquatica TaxID=1915309 RepID=A0A1L4D1I8_9BACT|nr:NAD(P)-binding protein [Silvanigrella aquatica]APJ04057.1 hypothetical protein AXG55_09120 [Silvanigrella aquatica]